MLSDESFSLDRQWSRHRVRGALEKRGDDRPWIMIKTLENRYLAAANFMGAALFKRRGCASPPATDWS